MMFEPFLQHMTQEMGLVSKRGIPAVLDESADGYVKSEAVACLLLERRTTANRVYAQVLASRVNNDGRKPDGPYFPSSKSQQELMTMTYKSVGIDPLKLTYIEGHMTGTKVFLTSFNRERSF